MVPSPARHLILPPLFALLAGLLASMVVPARPAGAAPVVSSIGDGANGATGASITTRITTTAPVAAGNSIIVSASLFDLGRTSADLSLSCSDPINGAYDIDGPIVGRTVIFGAVCAKHNSAALPSGTQITVQWIGTRFPRSTVAAVQVSGLASDPLDRTAVTDDGGESLDSGVTLTTSQAHELLIGAFAINQDIQQRAFTAGSNGTANPCSTSGTPVATVVASVPPWIDLPSTVVTECVVSVADRYRAAGTLRGGSGWVVRVLTYRASLIPSVVTTSGGSLAYTENQGAVVIDPGLTVTDGDSPHLTGATMSITGNYQPGQDVLAFTNTATITGSLNGTGDVLTLTGKDTVASYQAALRSVTYANTSDAPNSAPRTVSFQVTDDTGIASAFVTRDVTIAAINDPPVNTVPGAQTTTDTTPLAFTAGNGISVADVDAVGADVRTTLTVSSGTLTVGAAGAVPPLTSLVGSGTAAVTLVGTSAEITAALDGLTFTPSRGVGGPVTLTVTTNDQGNTGAAWALQDQDTVQIDVDVVPGLSIADASMTEGDAGTRTLTFTVTLNPPSAGVVTVPYATANGTATGGAACLAGVDYLAANGTLSFQPGDASETIGITVCGDAQIEGDETLLVNLGTPTGSVTVADDQGTGTIADDDQAGGVSFSAGTASVPENAERVTITVQRSGSAGPPANSSVVTGGAVRPSPSASPTVPGSGAVSPSALGAVTVDFATANGTATAGQDYTATSGTLSFGVGETTKTITIPILNDSLDEGDEQFTVVLSGPTGGAGLGQAVITVTIADTSHGSLPPSGDDPADVGASHDTLHGSSPPSGDDSADDERVERERETEEERRQRERTNRGNRDDDAVEGDVIETRCDKAWPAVMIANRDGLVEVRLVKEAQAACRSVAVGDYLEADGEKQHEHLFDADSVEIERRR